MKTYWFSPNCPPCSTYPPTWGMHCTLPECSHTPGMLGVALRGSAKPEYQEWMLGSMHSRAHLYSLFDFLRLSLWQDLLELMDDSKTLFFVFCIIFWLIFCRLLMVTAIIRLSYQAVLFLWIEIAWCQKATKNWIQHLAWAYHYSTDNQALHFDFWHMILKI